MFGDAAPLAEDLPDSGTMLLTTFYSVLLEETLPTIEIERTLFVFDRDSLRERLIRMTAEKESDPVILRACLANKHLFLPRDVRSMNDLQRVTGRDRGGIRVTTTFHETWAAGVPKDGLQPASAIRYVIAHVYENFENQQGGHSNRLILFNVTHGKIDFGSTQFGAYGGKIASHLPEFGGPP
jgi:hypothetical protein